MRWGDSRGGSAWGRPLALPMWRRNIVQLCVACLLTVLLGGSLQLNKLAVLDGAGRQFSQSSYGSKTGFLVPFAVFKAICNLIVGSLADRHGRKRIAVLGWIVGLVAPLMVLSAPTDERGWTTVVSSAAFLGMQQGLVWTCLILVTLDLCGPTARGFASGLSETVGYTAIAVFAQIYGGFERRDVSCAWSPAASADASTSPEDLARARGAACVAAVGGAEARCDTPDDWNAACVGACLCEGYTRAPFLAQLALMLVGVAVTLVALRESLRHAHLGAGSRDGGIAMTARGGRFRELVDDASDDDDETKRFASSRAATAAGGDPEASAEVAGDRARDASLDETAWGSFARTSFTHKSLVVVCVAGFCANFETGMAWGLMASWARDGLGVGGRERDFFTGAYSFLKGLSQLLAGLVSDRVGRKGPMSAGLIGGAASLLVAAFGAGYRGRFLPDVKPDDADLVEIQFGYLVLSGALLGLSTGLMYPVLAAAAADHAPEGRAAGTVGTVRFWRDLGYAMGMPIAALADASSAESALIFVAALMAAAGTLVATTYEEAMPAERAGYVPAGGEGGGVPSGVPSGVPRGEGDRARGRGEEGA